METRTPQRRRADPSRPRDVGRPADMAPLWEGVGALLKALGAVSARRSVETMALAGFSARTGYRPGGGPPVIVVGEEVALELGHPESESQAALVWTYASGLVSPGRVSLLGPDLQALHRGARWPFGLLVCLELDPGAAPDPFVLEQLLWLTNRLPGYMVRALPGRVWARVGATALARGLSLLDVGEALVHSFGEEIEGARAVEVVLVTVGLEAVRSLAPLVAEARVVSGQHKKLVLSPEGDLECEELDCERCVERETCDSLRDVLARRRAAKGSGWPTAAGGTHG